MSSDISVTATNEYKMLFTFDSQQGNAFFLLPRLQDRRCNEYSLSRNGIFS
jgi:hypothetical protein